ncbi:MAG TPA: DUF5916 domain-containing protein, partial [Vicinamibacterales bacterium]|nr:DUF5916 domain-containing protein [Vicinamibacterales bacterium]
MRIPAVALVLFLATTPALANPLPTHPRPRPPAHPVARVLHAPDGRLEVRAVRATTPVVVDGVLDDAVWKQAPVVSHFVESEPHEGRPATETTDVQVAFDARNLYIAAYCHDTDPAGIVLNDVKRDFAPGDQDDFEVILDTFADRRNGYAFITNAGGAKSDEQFSNEGRDINTSWDAVWHVRTRRVADGWIVEMAIPFHSLRFNRARNDLWGINFGRRVRRLNELDFWAPIPRSYDLTRVSLAGDLVGLTTVHPGRDLKITPYVLGSAVRAVGGTAFDRTGNAGFDLKYGVTPALTLDATVRPDFAQVEADEQQVNLTQFSQFFPEKRPFFLENAGLFYVGDAGVNNRITAPTPDEDLMLFFSRRVGLSPTGAPIPILGGARLTGWTHGFGVGLMTAQTGSSGSTPGDNYTVLRLRRDLFRNSDVGAIFMSRQATGSSRDFNRVYGVDANLRFFGNVDWSSYAIRTATPGQTTGQYAWRTSLTRDTDFDDIQTGVMAIGDHFSDDLGYYRRTGDRKWFLAAGIRPRLAALQHHGILEMHPHVTWSYYTDLSGRMVAKSLRTGYTFFFKNGGYAEVAFTPQFQAIDTPFTIHPGSPAIPAGRYGWDEYQALFNSDPSRPLSVSLTYTTGGLWSGTQRTLAAAATLRASYHFMVSLGLQRTAAHLDVPLTDFVADLWTLTTNYSFTRNMFLGSLIQYFQDQGAFNMNVRFNFIHHPLSNLYVVYNEQRVTTPEVLVPGRGLIVK